MESLKYLFEYHAKNVMVGLYGLKALRISPREDENLKKEIFAYNKQIELSFSSSKLSLNLAFTFLACEFFKNKSEPHIQIFYSQICLNLLYSNILGIIIHNIYLEFKSSYTSGLEYELPKISNLKQMLLHKNMFSFKYLSNPIVYLGFTSKN